MKIGGMSDLTIPEYDTPKKYRRYRKDWFLANILHIIYRRQTGSEERRYGLDIWGRSTVTLDILLGRRMLTVKRMKW
jgi:hypothetical protein